MPTKTRLVGDVLSIMQGGLIILVEAEPEHIQPDYTKEDGSLDTALNKRILKRAETNVWAWCSVKVTAKVAETDIEASDYLGCCSYRNAKDFVKNSGYFDQMKEQALQELREAVAAASTALPQIDREVATTKAKMQADYEAQRREIEASAEGLT